MRRRTFKITLTFSVERPIHCHRCPAEIPPWASCAGIQTARPGGDRGVQIICMDCVAAIQRERIAFARKPEHDRAERMENGWPEVEFSYACRVDGNGQPVSCQSACPG